MIKELTRRNFLKYGLGSLAIASFAPPALTALAKETVPQGIQTLSKAATSSTASDWAFVVDITKCIGCGRCVMACKLENHVPIDPDLNRTWIERYAVDADGEIYSDSPHAGVNGFPAKLETKEDLQATKSFFVPKLCNQCEHAPCISVCPVNASHKTSEGVVLIDQSRCIGCRYCIVACPYGARYLLPDHAVTPTGNSRVADKCTWCYHRTTKGLKPACVEACPRGARLFGNRRDENDPVAKILKEKEVHVLKPALGTKPHVFYIGLQDWL
ncbi:MAG: 4Fe-4S dicluster domain-containing protein [Dehalococcoidia bacterium]|nr:4Fe-4S dicluster domain-containing protein [Dehalococcoidia bacterium]